MMEKDHILIVEDETSMAKQLKWGLADLYDVSVAGDAKEALEVIDARPPLVVLLDLGLPPDPDGSTEGIRLLEQIAGMTRRIKVIIITGNTQREVAVKAIGIGAYDYHQKPVNIEELKIVLKRACYLSRLEEHVSRLEKAVTGESPIEGMIATSKLMMELFERARRVAKTGYPVLIQGQSGTGKERLARAIHQLSDRSERPLVIVDCGAIPENLLESELFGHEKGSFTSAIKQRIGKFEQATGGTIFLDEVGDMSLAAQAKVLRALQESKITRVGSDKDINVDVRVIAATNKNIRGEIDRNTFREDLYHRLSVILIHVPTLNERSEDIPLLADYFNTLICNDYGMVKKKIRPDALTEMQKIKWTGNIREFRNVLERLIILCPEEISGRDVITYAHPVSGFSEI